MSGKHKLKIVGVNLDDNLYLHWHYKRLIPNPQFNLHWSSLPKDLQHMRVKWNKPMLGKYIYHLNITMDTYQGKNIIKGATQFNGHSLKLHFLCLKNHKSESMKKGANCTKV